MKKFVKALLINTLLLVMIFGIGSNGLSNVQAIDESEKNTTVLESRAIEKYTKKVNIQCGKYGYVTVIATISHNMTTGKFYVYNTDYNTHFNTGYGGVGVSAFSTNPAKGQEIKGKVISAKITYYQFGILSETVTGNIYL